MGWADYAYNITNLLLDPPDFQIFHHLSAYTALCLFLSEWRHGKILPRSYGSVYVVLDSAPSKVELRPRPIAHHGLLKCKNLCCCQVVMPMGRSKLPRRRTSACCCVVFLYGNLGMLEILNTVITNLLPQILKQTAKFN